MFELVDVRWRHPGDNPTQYKGWWDIWDTLDNTELCLSYFIKDRWHRAHSREGRANHPKFAFKKMPFPCILIHWCISKCIVQCLADVSLASHCTHSCLLYLSVSAPCPPVSLLSGNIFYPISDWVSNSQNADSGNNLSSIIYNTDELNGRPVYKHIEHDVIAISFLCLELESALVCCCKTLTSEALFLMDQSKLG